MSGNKLEVLWSRLKAQPFAAGDTRLFSANRVGGRLAVFVQGGLGMVDYFVVFAASYYG